MKRYYELIKVEHENLKIEVDKEKIISKTKFREELDMLI